MLEKKNIRDFQPKDPIDHYFLLKKIEKRKKKDGSDYLILELVDKTGSIYGNYWENFDKFLQDAEIGSIVKVTGNVEIFNERLQLRIDEVNVIKENENVSLTDFLPVAQCDIDEMKKEFKKQINSIKNHWLKALLKKIFNEERFQKFAHAPAGKSFHHNYIGGLLEHTLEVIKLCDLMYNISESSKQQPVLNRDLLIAGAILHDIGKIEELSYDTFFDYTDKGRLIGHIVIAANYIYSACREIPYFPEELETLLTHLVLSHQGKLENATPVEPKILEAIVLYYADEMSAKMNAYRQIIRGGIETQSSWTKYHNVIQSSLFIQKDPEYYNNLHIENRTVPKEENNNDEQPGLFEK